MNEKHLPDFSGKVVFVQLKLVGHFWTLLGPTFERQAGKLFLVSKAHHDDAVWARGALVYIPLDQVAWYVVFDSLESYNSRSVSTPTPVVEKRRGWLGMGRKP